MIVGFNEYKNQYQFQVSGIIHVGAHFGQEYEEYIQNFGQIKTHWFEPIPQIFETLKSTISDKPGVSLYNVALGDSDTFQSIYMDSGNGGQSSSLLEPKEHKNIFSHITFEDSNRFPVKVMKLDSFHITDSNMLVLDTQGYELVALRGSTKTLDKIDYLFTEFNTVEMYKDCPKIEDIDDFLRPYGFQRAQTWYTPGNWGDAFYIKNKTI
jgi:FkbM family methyltransferase